MHVVITGANRGIGWALTQQYLQQGADVTAICRAASSELRASKATVIEGIDVSQEEAIAKLPSALAGRSIDILINNAGILHSETLDNMDTDHIQQQLMINSVAPLLVTHTLQSQLVSGSKVALITSRMGSIADNGSGGFYGYRMSKAALNAAGMSLSHDLAPRGISVAILHPGFVSTEMVGFSGEVSPTDSAANLIQRIEGLSLANTGTFWHANGEQLPW